MANADEGTEQNEPFEGLPDNLQILIANVGFPEFNLEPHEQEVYDRARGGKCMLCAKDLGEDSLFTITRHGIVAGFCSGTCHTDMGVLGFLQEQLQDLNDRVDFREGDKGDEPEGA